MGNSHHRHTGEQRGQFVNAITVELVDLRASYLYRRCIYLKSWPNLNFSDLDLKVRRFLKIL